VLVRGLAVDDCHVVTEAGDASDHLPVVATLRAEVG
jgi:endonuclease/exonuclease/phosphatase family metal-dependent hydrolase